MNWGPVRARPLRSRGPHQPEPRREAGWPSFGVDGCNPTPHEGDAGHVPGAPAPGEREPPRAPPRPSPGHCPAPRAGSVAPAPGWCPRPASRWSRPHCRARSLCPARGPAEGEETGSQQGLGRGVPDSLERGSSSPSPSKAGRGEGETGRRGGALLPLWAAWPDVVREERWMGPQPGTSNTGPGASHPHPQGHCFPVKARTGRQSSLAMGEGPGNPTPTFQPPRSCVSGLLITSPHGFQAREATCSSVPASDLCCSSGISA